MLTSTLGPLPKKKSLEGEKVEYYRQKYRILIRLLWKIKSTLVYHSHRLIKIIQTHIHFVYKLFNTLMGWLWVQENLQKTHILGDRVMTGANKYSCHSVNIWPHGAPTPILTSMKWTAPVGKLVDACHPSQSDINSSQPRWDFLRGRIKVAKSKAVGKARVMLDTYVGTRSFPWHDEPASYRNTKTNTKQHQKQ